MTPVQIAALVASSAAAGVMNAMAGGGTILTFPTLLWLGESAITANATSTVALWPGGAASMFGYRKEVAEHRGWLKTLFLPSLLGGALGAVLLIATPVQAFARLAPFLILFATLLFMVQGAVARWTGTSHGSIRTRPRLLLALFFQFAVGVYGGYFGAGIGILMLAVLGFLGLSDIHAANGIKNFFAICINGVAAAYFIARGAVDWRAAAVMMVAGIAGGYAGARFARRIGRERARTAVVVIGFVIVAILLYQRSGW
ncbi:MAG: sulfite exporter TauE/SafE family protein [Acidobacteriota bacterium]|nr:sulfite exporter TauE/SafE family protein [Acidobacteriota bacterium]